MRRACSLGPACSGEAASTVNNSAPATAARRPRAETTCAVLVLTFMALVNSQTNDRMRELNYTTRATPPRMSQQADVASHRQFVLLLCCTAQCTTNCEPVHGGRRIERLPSRSTGPYPCGGIRTACCRARRDGIGAIDEQQGDGHLQAMNYVTLAVGRPGRPVSRRGT